jgi:hypothetical protein
MLLKSRVYIPGSVMLFESRYHRFVYISDVSVLNERVWGFLRVKHVLYSFLVVIFLWRGYSASSPAMLSMRIGGLMEPGISIINIETYNDKDHERANNEPV